MTSLRYQRGVTYIEVMVATVLIALTLIPALDALSPGMQGSVLHRQHAEVHYALSGMMEKVLAEPFGSLDAAATAAGSWTVPTSYSDVFSPEITRNVYIWRYDVDDADLDGDVMTGGEDDLLWIRVALADDSQSLQTLLAR